MNLKFYICNLFLVLSCYYVHCALNESDQKAPSIQISEGKSELSSDSDSSGYSSTSLSGSSLPKEFSGFDDMTGSLGLVALTKNGKLYSRVISGNFSKANDGINSYYLLFDTTYKNFVGIYVSGVLDFTINGKLGKVVIVHDNELFLLNKFVLLRGDNELTVTNTPWNLKVELGPDFKKFNYVPNELKNKDIVRLPPADWDANLDSIYPSGIKSITPISIMNKKDGTCKKLTIPHFAVGTSPTALFLKLSTGEYMGIIVTNNTVFFVDIDDCSIHSSNGHYYNVCSGYSIYNKRWFLTNKPWGQRIVINANLSDLYSIMKNKLEEIEDSDDAGEPSTTSPETSDPARLGKCTRYCTRCKCNN